MKKSKITVAYKTTICDKQCKQVLYQGN